MKHLKTRLPLLTLLIVLILPLAGCVSKSKYETLDANYESLSTRQSTLTAEYQKLQTDYNNLKANDNKLQTNYSELQTKYNNLQDQHNSLASDNSKINTKLSEVQADLSVAKATNDQLKKEQTTLQTSYTNLESNYRSAQNQLNQIQKVYPPKYFASGDALRAWLMADDISKRAWSNDPIVVYEYTLELQNRALRDGYIINTTVYDTGTTPNFYRISCTAMTEENSLYFWDVFTDDINYLIRNIKDFIWVVGAR